MMGTVEDGETYDYDVASWGEKKVIQTCGKMGP